MATQNKPDVRVKLSAEGVAEVVNAFKKIADEGKRSGKNIENSFAGVGASLGGVRGILSKVSTLVAGISFASLARDALNYANSVGEASQKIGASTENFSVLNFAATTAGVSMEELTASLARTAKTIGDLQNKNKEAERSFAQLGLSAKDFAGRDTVQAFDLIAQRLGTLPDGLDKTRLAQDLLGKSGANLMVLVNDLAVNGFDSFAASAERMGLTVSQQTALLADAVGDSFDTMKNQARGLSVQFLAGFLPSVKQALDGFSDATEEKGVKQMERFGQEAGRVLRTVAAIFKLFGNIVAGVFQSIGDNAGAVFAAMAAFAQGDYTRAAIIIKDRFIQTFDDIKTIGSNIGKDFKNIIEQASKGRIEIEVAPKKTSTSVIDVESAEEEKSRKKAEADEEAAHKKRLERARELARERVTARDKLFEIENQLLEAQGRGEEVFERRLQKQREEIEQILAVLRVADDERAAFLDRFESTQRSAFNFDGQKKNFEEIMKQLDDARDRINLNAEAGVISQFQAQQQIMELEASRIPQLQQIVELMRQQAETLGPDAIKTWEDYKKQLEDVVILHQKSADSAVQLQDAVGEGLQSGLENTLQNFKDISSAGDLVKGVLNSIADAVLQMAAKILAQKAALAILSAFAAPAASASSSAAGVVEVASGGHITGPGGPTTDSIPAWLSNGEFVVRAAVVQQPGMLDLLHRINGSNSALRGFRSTPRFAGGGEVLAKSSDKSGPNIRIQNVVDPRMTLDVLGTPEGERVILNIIDRNPSRTKRT